MKKLVAIALASFLALSFGAAFAQDLSTASDEATHQVEVIVPEVLFVRILGTDPMVTFNLAGDVNAYLAAADAGTSIGATSSTMTGVEVWANMAWELTVEADEFVDAGSLVIANIQVTPTRTPGTGVDTVEASFYLDATDPIASGSATEGWSSVGIDGDDYAIFVDGSEAEGTHTTTVTYTIASL